MHELPVALALFACIYATYTDLRYGIVPNRLTFPMIGVGFAYHLGLWIYYRDVSFFIDFLRSFVSVFLVVYIFWLLGMLSAGDGKLLMALASLVPVPLHQSYIAWYPFGITYIVNSFLGVFPLLFIYGTYELIRRRKFRVDFKPKDLGKLLEGALHVFSAYSLSDFLNPLVFFIYFPVLYIIGKRLRIFASMIVSALYIYLQGYRAVGMAVLIFSGVILFRVILGIVGMIRKRVFVEEVPVTSLRPGDIIAEDIYQHRGEVIRASGIVERAKARLSGGTPVAQARASGLEEEEIGRLKELVEEGKLENSIKLRKRMPFAPAILLGFILSLIFGDLSVMLKVKL